MSYIRSQRRVTSVLLCAFLWHSCQSQLHVIKEQSPAEGSSQSREQAVSSTLVSSPDSTDAVIPNSAAEQPRSLQCTIPGHNASGAITPYATINDTKKRLVDEDSKSMIKCVKTNKVSSNDWFESFIKTVEKIEKDTTEEEAWREMEKVLDEGVEHELLETSVMCPNDKKPNGEEEYEYTPLHYAAAKGLLVLVRELVEQWGVPVDIQTTQGRNTPLHLAASRGRLDVVNFLVDKKATIDKTDEEGLTALHYAASGGNGEMNREVIAYLVTKGANVKKLTASGTSLLNLAVFTRNIAVVEYWVDAFSKDSDPEISTLTKRALKMARYKRKKGEKYLGLIISILQGFFDARSK